MAKIINDLWPTAKLIVTGRTRALVLDYVDHLPNLREPHDSLYLRFDKIIPLDDYYDYNERRVKWGTDFPGEVESVADHHAKLHIIFSAPGPIPMIVEALARRHPTLRFIYYYEKVPMGPTLTIYASNGRITKEVRGTAPARKAKAPSPKAESKEEPPPRADKPPEGWPAYVKLGRACLRFKHGRYYRDAGDWWVGACFEPGTGKLYASGRDFGFLQTELRPTDYWTWKADNVGYIKAFVMPQYTHDAVKV